MKRLKKIGCECTGDCYCAENFAQVKALKKHFEENGSIFTFIGKIDDIPPANKKQIKRIKDYVSGFKATICKGFIVLANGGA